MPPISYISDCFVKFSVCFTHTHTHITICHFPYTMYSHTSVIGLIAINYLYKREFISNKFIKKMIKIEVRNYLRSTSQIHLMAELLKLVGMSIDRLYPKDKVINILYSLLKIITIDFKATEMYHTSSQEFLSRCKNNIWVIMNCLIAIGEPKPAVIAHVVQSIPIPIWPNWTE